MIKICCRLFEFPVRTIFKILNIKQNKKPKSSVTQAWDFIKNKNKKIKNAKKQKTKNKDPKMISDSLI